MSTYDRNYRVAARGLGMVSGDYDRIENLSDGCGRVWWNIPVPGYANSVRYYRDVRQYTDLSLTVIATCGTCGGSGTVVYAVDARLNKRFPRTRACPDHLPTIVEAHSVYAIPTIEEVLKNHGRSYR